MLRYLLDAIIGKPLWIKSLGVGKPAFIVVQGIGKRPNNSAFAERVAADLHVLHRLAGQGSDRRRKHPQCLFDDHFGIAELWHIRARRKTPAQHFVHLVEHPSLDGIVRDISARRHAEQVLRESEARFRMAADSAPTMIWISGLDKGCTWFNRRWLEFTGRTMEQELGDGWAQGVHPEDVDRCTKTYHGAFDAQAPFEIEYRLRRFDGRYRWICDAGIPIHLQDGSFAGYIGSCADITERKLGEEALLERVAQRTHELSETNARLLHEIEERRRIESLLATEKRMLELVATGAGQDELLETICEEIESLIPHCQCAIRLSRDSSETEESGLVTRGLDAFGDIAGQGVYPPLTDRTVVAHLGRNWSNVLRAHKIQSYWLEPIIAPGGTVVGTLGVYIADAAGPSEDELSVGAMAARMAGIAVERARADARERAQLAQLAHVARLATMGEMASEFAHELNQPLCAIVNFTEACNELVRKGAYDRQQLCRALGEVAGQAERAGKVIRWLRDFARRREPERRPVDINSIVNNVVAFTNVEIHHSEIRVRVKLGKRLPKVFADSIQIEQVLVNLIRNGCEAMREGGKGPKVLTIDTVRRRGAVEVRVSDRGPGVPEEIKKRLFEPFFTTKENGLGMGLSITRSIVEVHEGRLWATSNGKGGAVFHFVIPTYWSVHHGRRHGFHR